MKFVIALWESRKEIIEQSKERATGSVKSELVLYQGDQRSIFPVDFFFILSIFEKHYTFAIYNQRVSNCDPIPVHEKLQNTDWLKELQNWANGTVPQMPNR